MKGVNYIKQLNAVSAYQKGMFTSAQAKRAGVERYVLARLENDGAIERVIRGVYRMGGAPSLREEEVFAAWLSLNPNREPGIEGDTTLVPVATGVTAAWLQELGEIGPTPLEFCTESRRQTQRGGLAVRKRKIPKRDIVYVDSIPATSPSRTVIDLIDSGEDLSLVASVLNDAVKRGLIQDEDELAAEVNRKGKKAGLPKSARLYELLTKGR